MNETVVQLGESRTVIGIVTLPDDGCRASGHTAVVILNAGFVHRVGPNRIHVKLARHLATLGLPVLRFDSSGIGDSVAHTNATPSAQNAVAEVGQVMDALSSKLAVQRFILIGICSGADLALRAAGSDPRVVGVVAINGTFLDHGPSSALVQTLENSISRRYYQRNLLSIPHWYRLLTGQTNTRRLLKRLLSRMCPRRVSGRQIEWDVDIWNPMESLLRRGVNLLLVYAEGSKALDAFRLTLEPCLRTRRSTDEPCVYVLNGADHVFTLLSNQAALVDLILKWTAGVMRERACADASP